MAEETVKDIIEALVLEKAEAKNQARGTQAMGNIIIAMIQAMEATELALTKEVLEKGKGHYLKINPLPEGGVRLVITEDPT